MIELSIVSPVYLGNNSMDELVSRLDKNLSEITDSYEIILVEDHSPDNSWDKIVELSTHNKKIKGIKLSKNFGQHAAITAGLERANGNYIVVMDCDLQDRPEEIINLYKKAREGYEVVVARRENRQHSFLKKFISKSFYKVFNYLTGTNQDPTVANFGIYSKKSIQAVLSMKDHSKFFPAMINWVGFKSSSILVTHDKRFEGETSYNIRKLIELALHTILSFSDKPLRLLVMLGLFVSSFSFLMILVFIVLYLMGKITVLGYSSLIISIWFFSGLIISVIGLVGLYIGRIFEQSKERPVYIVEEMTNAE